MDEITLKPTPKTEDGNSPKNEKANYEMDPLVVTKKAQNEQEDEIPKDINAMMEAEKKARQLSAKAADAPEEVGDVPPPTAKKPDSSSKSAEKIVEIMLSPPAPSNTEEAPKVTDEPKKEEKPITATRSEDITESETDKAPAEKKPSSRKKKAATVKAENDIKEEKATQSAPKAQENVPTDKLPKEIEAIDIPISLANDAKNSKPVPQKTQESSIEGLKVSQPVFVDVDSNVAQATDKESYGEEFKRLMALEEANGLSEGEKRRLQIIRLIELKRKGKSNPFANDNLVALMSEERGAGNDVSTFEQALADINGAAPAAQNSATAIPAAPMKASQPAPQAAQPARAQTQPVINKPAPVKQEVVAQPAKKEKKFPIVPVIVIAAVVVIGVIIGIVLLGGKGNTVPDETSATETTALSSDDGTTETTVEATTTAATELISAGNIVDATVIEVSSGDTFKATIGGDTYTVKMIGVKAPTGTEKYAKESKTYVEKIIGGKDITLEFDTQINNADNELLAYVWYNNGGVLFNDELIMLGYVKVDLSDINKKFNDEFTKMETSAKNDKKGLWSPQQTTPAAKPTTTTVPATVAKAPYVSRNLKVFHRNTCPLAYDTRYGANIFEFQTREEAVDMGCKPCAECNP